MQTQSRRASDITAEAERVVRDGAVRVKAVGSGHTETVVGVVGACFRGGGGSVVFQLGAPPVASWWVARGRHFSCRLVTQPQTRSCRLARCFVQNGDSSAHTIAQATVGRRIPVRTHVILPT